MKIIKPPEEIFLPDDEPIIFLAGSIEMGQAIDWQKEVCEILNKKFPTTGVIFNPRRDNWDSSWEQDINNKHFHEQVEWELKALENSNVIGMYLAPNTKSPISLLELGLYAKSNKLIVFCPDGFWRKGNIDIVCNRYKIPQIRVNETIDNQSKLFEIFSNAIIDLYIKNYERKITHKR